VGIGWPVVFGLFWWKARRYVLELERGHAIEVIALAIATLFSFSLLLSNGITLFHSVVFVAIFIGYLAIIARAPVQEPHLVEPARTLGGLPDTPRRITVGALIVFAAGAVVASAEPFAESLIGAGVELGIDEFLLVQWVAPFASEAPEFLIASLLALSGRSSAGIGTLVSSKVNQWTLLIASLPIAYGLGGGGWSGLPFDGRQWEELFITAAQSVLAVVLIARLRFTWWGAAILLVLFVIQFLMPSSQVRMTIAWIYLGLAAVILASYGPVLARRIGAGSRN
jgi:cation:H+ antiporter